MSYPRRQLSPAGGGASQSPTFPGRGSRLGAGTVDSLHNMGGTPLSGGGGGGSGGVKCKVPGCTEQHASHFCKKCRNKDSDHRSSHCPGGVGLACRVHGRTEEHPAHFCRTCGDSNSDHFSRNCTGGGANGRPHGKLGVIEGERGGAPGRGGAMLDGRGGRGSERGHGGPRRQLEVPPTSHRLPWWPWRRGTGAR